MEMARTSGKAAPKARRLPGPNEFEMEHLRDAAERATAGIGTRGKDAHYSPRITPATRMVLDLVEELQPVSLYRKLEAGRAPTAAYFQRIDNMISNGSYGGAIRSLWAALADLEFFSQETFFKDPGSKGGAQVSPIVSSNVFTIRDEVRRKLEEVCKSAIWKDETKPETKALAREALSMLRG